jgi:hypothetical protein
MVQARHMVRSKARREVCAYELNGKLWVHDSTMLLVQVARPAPELGYADPTAVIAMTQLRVELMPTHMWFLNRLKSDDNGREARVLRYDALRDSWMVVARHRW